MPKTLVIEAKTRNGEVGDVTVECPTSLAEAVQMFGEKEVFKGFIATKVIEWQREARPAKTGDENGAEKPKKRLSVFDRLNAS